MDCDSKNERKVKEDEEKKKKSKRKTNERNDDKYKENMWIFLKGNFCNDTYTFAHISTDLKCIYFILQFTSPSHGNHPDSLCKSERSLARWLTG